MDFSSLLNVGAQGLTAYKKGQQQRRFADLALGEKEQAAELDRRMKEAQIAEAQARAEALLHPPAKPAAEKSPHYITNEEGQFAVGEGNVAQPIIGPDGKPLKGSRTPGDSYSFPTGTDAQGNAIVLRGNNRTGAIERTDIGRPTPGANAGSAKLKAAAIANRKNLHVIDEAIAAVEANPDAFGLKNVLGDAVSQRIDPNGVRTRAPVADIGSLLIHDRTGAAMSAKEAVRLQPFIPSPTDTPQAVQTKLRRLKEVLEAETQALEDAAAGRNAMGGAPDEAPPSTGGRTITVNGKTFRLPE